MPGSSSLTLLVLLAGSGLQSEAVSTFAQGPSAPGPTAAALPQGPESGAGVGLRRGPRLPQPPLLCRRSRCRQRGCPLLTHAVIAAKRLTHLSLRIHCSPVPPSRGRDSQRA